MRYTDSLLADGEIVVRRARQHWLAPLVQARRAWLLLLIGALALVAGLAIRDASGIAGRVGLGLAVLSVVALAAGLVFALYHVLAWRAQDYVVTNRRVVQVEGILNKRAADSSLEKINDAVLEQSLLGRILGFGDLEVLTASESAIDRFHMLSRAADFKREMLNQKHALELEVGRAPAPPLRVDPAVWNSPSPGPAGAAQPTSVAGEAGSMPPTGDHRPDRADPEQIMSTLARLAELRDRGAITPQEFEAKKAELLARL
jgi:hypothetical protein